VRELADAKRVLNLFAYCGAFTVAAAAGGAARTVSVDASGAALERAARNLRRWGADAHQLLREDVAACLRRFRRRGERFDLVVLDPPSFSTTRRSTFRAARDYADLAELAFGCVAPGGALFASTAHRRIGSARLRASLEQAAGAAGKAIAGMEHVAPPGDHPPAPGEMPHLKTFVAFVR
jgi:23S rRNA (cytosine1962-C5)-methyltransferase